MTREVVAIEGKVVHGCLIEMGALTPLVDFTPIMWAFNYDRPIGRAYDMERDEATGEVSFDLKVRPEFKRDREEAKLHSVAVEIGNVKGYTKDDGVRVITNGVIRSVSVVPTQDGPFKEPHV